ncbi:hypothetical protein SAMN05660297_00026 [Natronincola peptidivorans]|uniref:Uncharacterized protein n=1 Tax=Natronincola peptidivorans TaxID=426128 RepID=A0A1H9Y4A4_9FIRM|nr:hypothetical protein [Natronincola peptidivorans]SES63690.1 hypothetical protein SAMN05660297_00026 [Natronincola peptidivorans]
MIYIGALIVIAFLLLGYYIMDKVDKFIENNIQHSNEYHNDEYTDPSLRKQKVLLIYGNNTLTNLVKKYCDSQKYMYESITDIHSIDTQAGYIYLFALSNKDADNLMVGSIGFKIYSIPNVISLCNNQKYLKIYNEFSFIKALPYNHDIDKLFNAIKGVIEDAVNDKAKI